SEAAPRRLPASAPAPPTVGRRQGCREARERDRGPACAGDAMTDRPVPHDDACTELAARLEIDVDSSGVCLACLSFVSMPLADGDEATARRETRRLAVASSPSAS